MSAKKKFYITTPIYYVNDKPHIGHAYTTILADVLARYRRLAGEEVFFLTGLDEHGQKVQQAARKRGLDPRQHCDDLAPRFLQLWEKLHIRFDDFIRTTEARHGRVVQAVLELVHARGDIYFDEYGGYYCVGCERFYTDRELEDGKCPQHQTELDYVSEKNYFFRMSRYQQRLRDHIQAHPEFIQPDHRRNEVLGFLRQPLGDLCISRPKARMSWGIELPFDREYVTYVWFDALLNYVTAPGYLSDPRSFNHWWPADYHLIGKDILTTHAVYWPAMLFAAGIPLPRTIFAHGWWLVGATKMSKSLGNIINPLDLIDRFGVDPVRYYLMREMVLGLDANFTLESFVKRYNSDLANDFGNLLSRVTRLIEKDFQGRIPDAGREGEAERHLRRSAAGTVDSVRSLIGNMRVNEALETIMNFIRSVNRYLEQQAPWKLVREDRAAAGRVLYHAGEALRIGARLLEPVMPNRSQTVLEVLRARDTAWDWGGLPAGEQLGTHPVLFPRIDPGQDKRLEPNQPQEQVMDTMITIEEFKKLDLRTAEVLRAEKVAGADRLLKLNIRIGSEERQIVAGIAEFYQPEELVGRLIVVVANLKPVKIRGIESRGMLLAAKQGSQLTLVNVDDPALGSGAEVS